MYDRARSATILCSEDTYVAVLSKKDFDSILKEKEEFIIMSNLRYFYSLPYFEEWDLYSLRFVYLASIRKKFKKGQCVFEEGSPAEAVYIIKSGEFSLYKKFECTGK